MNETLQTIRNRRSIRSFQPEQITNEELDLIIEAAMYAPSGNNGQSWHFTVIQNKEIIEYMNRKSKEYLKNAPFDWMRTIANNPNTILSYNAPTIVVVSGSNKGFSPNADCCAAIENMLLAAESLNIGSVWIGLMKYFLESAEEASKIGVPEGYNAYYCVALGYKMNRFPVKAPERNMNVINYML